VGKFKTKQRSVEAVQFVDTTESIFAIANLAEGIGNTTRVNYKNDPPILKVHTKHGTLVAAIGDFIMKSQNGIVYSCAPEEFFRTYEPA
jgi:hypothetical protein